MKSSSFKKVQYWFHVDVPYLELTYALFNHPKIEIGKPSKGRFTFKVKELELSDVTFQLARRKNVLGIFAPIGLDIEEILRIIKPILDEAVRKPVILQPYAIEGEKVSEKHVEDIVSGLISLCRDAYEIEHVKANPMFRMLALQHIYTGYAELQRILDDLSNAKDEMERALNDVASKLDPILREMGVKNEKVQRASRHIAEKLLISHGKYEHYMKMDFETGYYVAEFGGYILAKFDNKDEVEGFIKKLGSVLKVFIENGEFKQELQRYEKASNMYQRLSDVLHGKDFGYLSERERLGELRLLIVKLTSKTEKLKGKCEVCGGRFDEKDLKELKKLDSIFLSEVGKVF